ncbi:DUF2292 domain-containing protein [Nitrosomonas communis]|uniref:Uncharacterized protein n=1 Tax=Nitrosomonas communis TaxID=44574 RepID=A0A1I4X4W9_9PROT|nr:DUF2292 domain-containing protein [Nitrosomonas communis]SFN20947.1 hypothetical protein SAMN05421863_11354 [Nitrosomonas communis]
MTNRTIQKNSHPFYQDIQQENVRAATSIEYGCVENMIHDSQVVHTKCRERIRTNYTNSIRTIK